jgi:hypothetical protein
MNNQIDDSTAPLPAPEVPPGMEEAQVWDDPPSASGTRTPPLRPADESDTTGLVEEGLNEADRELRIEDEAESEDEEMTDETAPPSTGILS